MKNDMRNVIISDNLKPAPEAHEQEAAWIVANHYKRTIEFLEASRVYKRKTPDFIMDGLEWEMKCPRGNKIRTIQNNVELAKKQSPNIVIDARYIKISDIRVERALRREFILQTGIKRMLMITKDKRVIEIKTK